MNLQSDFGLLDVKRGKKALANLLAKGGSVIVTIEATITKSWGNDDGTSQEFELEVCSVQARKED